MESLVEGRRACYALSGAQSQGSFKERGLLAVQMFEIIDCQTVPD